MARYCSDCTYFNPKDKKGGVEGYCKCSKVKKYLLANQPACDKFGKAYSRRAYDCEKLYDSAKKASNAFSGKETPVIVPVLLLITLIILKIFKVI